MARYHGRAALLGGAALAALSPAPMTLAQEAPDATIVLDRILVEQEVEELTALGGEDAQDTGTTVLGSGSVGTRTDVTGDINTVLRMVPTVQYANDTSQDAGENNDDALNLQPMEFSIAGGAVNENNIMIDGIGVNSLTGTTDPYRSDPEGLSRETGTPNIFAVYGMHSQTQFVPSSMVEEVEVMDSNVSAEIGEFTGGAVNYKLKQPDLEEAGGSISLNWRSDELVHYKIGTPDGENPDGYRHPEWTKYGLSFDFTTPVGENSAVLFGYSRRKAETTKTMDPQYVYAKHDTYSYSDFYRLSFRHRLEEGGLITLGANYTDYRQDWIANSFENMEIDTVNQGLMTFAEYEKDLGDLSLFGLPASGVTFETRLGFQHNTTRNDHNNNLSYTWYASYDDGFLTDNFSDWCTPTPGERTRCATGSFGDRTYEDDRLKAEAKLSGDIWQGTFAMGASVEGVKARRTGEGFTMYSATRRLSQTSLPAFVCDAGDASCYDDIYQRIMIDQVAYDETVEATKLEGFLQTNQTIGDFELRGGLRLDYDDYMENVNIAPRFAVTWDPDNRWNVTFGANRYYSDDYLAYAIHDAVPRTRTWMRNHDSTTGEVGDWTQLSDLGNYSYNQGGLDTPYNDELTLAFGYTDPLTEGNWRLKTINRQGKDLFARSGDSSTYDNTLTNDGSSDYTSITLEYTRDWQIEGPGILEAVGFYGAAVYAERSISNNVYFGSDGQTGAGQDFYYYNGKSYAGPEFKEVTGNMDVPIRATFEVSGKFRNDRLRLGLGADVTFGYEGVRDTGENEQHDHPRYGTHTHDVYVDHDYDAVVSTFLNADVKLADIRGNPLMLNVKVSNLFDDVGNATSTDDNPWVSGRSASFGVNYTW